ncbi:hypothetical protein HIM_10924 [Hirsutella minnesotensis 3608]|uniref:Uncharacterized protein n=1 Tax=Hirsutella minnesotensis 3608 TaxID=1043627 RepID=A0A0F7ZWW4_9HYPO|nr:hypothetical protein HIM_10924 [Hirsutella minnesotensis 3608]
MRSTVSTIRAIHRTPSSRPITTYSFHLSSSSSKNTPTANTNANPTSDDGGFGTKGRTGGGQPLASSSPNAPAKPKVYNSNISGSGSDPANQLTDEQKKEVDEHNRHFAQEHGHRKTPPGEKVDDRFWKGSSKG